MINFDSMESLLSRITINPAVCNGRPTIRDMRFTVSQLLELLAAGMTADEILADYPYLEALDIRAALQYASNIANSKSLTPLNAA